MTELGLAAVDVTASPLLGPAGNREFLMRLRWDGVGVDDAKIDAVVGERMST
jgi:hypothetical protein